MQPLALAYDADAHEYRVDGERWPSVTEILQPLNELDGIPAEVLRRAADFGTNVHLAVHLINTGRLDRASLDEALAPYVHAWEQWLLDSGAVVVASEVRVLHPTLRYAGTMDSCVRLKARGKTTLHAVDVKTSATVPRTAALQTAAYREAYLRVRRDLHAKRYALHLRRDGTYRAIPYDDTRDWSYFTSCLNLWRWRNG